MATKIPQNVDKEDKLVGPLTLRQFLYVLGGAALIFIVSQYYTMGYLYLIEFILLSLPIAALAIALAFVNINGQPFQTFLWHFFSYVISPKQFVWNKNNQDELLRFKLKHPSSKSPSTSPKTGEAPTSELEKLAHILDTGGKMDTDELANTHIVQVVKPKPSFNEQNLQVEDILQSQDNEQK